MADVMQLIRGGFFDSVNQDRLYSASDMTMPYKRIVSDGIFPDKNGSASQDFIVSFVEGMLVSVAPGNALLGGRWAESLEALDITVAGNSSAYDRIDSIILRADASRNVRAIGIVYRQGEAAASPMAPALESSADVKELRIANIYVASGAASLSSASISDQRGTEDCPWVAGVIPPTQAQIGEAVDEYLDEHPGIFVVDDEFSDSSTNAVQNKVVAAAVGQLTEDVADVNGRLQQYDNLLEIPTDVTLSAISNASYTQTPLGEVTLKNGVTYTFDFFVDEPVGSYLPIVSIRDTAAETTIWNAQMATGTTHKTWTYTCESDEQTVLLRFQIGTSAETTVHATVTSDEQNVIEQIESKMQNALNYGNSLFTSTKSADGTRTDGGHATCFKRERESYVNGIRFACEAYASHTYFCAFDEQGDIISSYSMSGVTHPTEEHSVTFGDDVCYYSVQTLKSKLSTSYLEELTDYGAVIVENDATNQLYKDKTYAAIKAAEMKKWSEMQLGMFIHWGVYSAWAGVYDGPNIDGTQIHVTGGTEWMWQNYKIPKSNYMAKAADFTGAAWNPDYICMLAKSLGMGQIVITARHHEGFSLMETSFCEWDITDSGCTRDVLMDLKNACVRHGLKFSLYVSPLLDWCDEGGYGQQVWNGGSDPYTFAQHKGFVENQIQYMNQLVEKYDPYVIWYDGGTYLNTQVTDDMQRLFNNNQLRVYPYTIVNNRGEGTFDYRLAENTYADYPNTTNKYERCWFLAGWGYNTGHNSISNYRTKQALIWDMLENMGRGFNYLLNISPKGDGSLPSPTGVRFAELASIFRKYTFFNGAKRIFNWSQPSWGRPIKISNSIYMFAIPGHSGTLYLDSVLTNNIKGVHVYDISDPDSASNYSVVSDDRLRIDNVPTTSDDYFTVVRVDYYGEPICMDYNIVDSGIRGMSMVKTAFSEWASTTTVVLIDGTYRFGTDVSTSVSRFKFAGETGTYTFAPTGTQNGEVSFTYKLYDAYGVLISEGTSFTLTNGEIYKVEVSKTGSGTLIMNELSINSAS